MAQKAARSVPDPHLLRPAVRPRRRRRRHQRRRHRPRCRGSRPPGAPRRERRPRVGDVAVEHEADPRRASLSRAVRIPARPRGAGGTRDRAAPGSAHRRAAGLRPAARAAPAAGVDAACRALPLRPSRAARDAPGFVRRRPVADAMGRRVEAAIPQGLRLFGCARRRRAARRLQRDGCPRARRRRPRRHAARVRAARARCGRAHLAGDARCAGGRTVRGHRPRDRQRDGTLGQGRARRDRRRAVHGDRAPRQGQPHRGPARARRRSRLHPAERRQADRLRHSVRELLLADRHDGRLGGGRTSSRRSRRTRSTTCSGSRIRISRTRSAARTSCGASAACARSTTTGRRIPRRSRAITRSRSTTPAARARRSLSIYGGKITTYRKLAEHALDRLARVPAGDEGAVDRARAAPRRRPAGGRIRRMDCGARPPVSGAAGAASVADSPGATARAHSRSSATRVRRPTWAKTSATGSRRRRSAISCATSGRAPPMTCCGGGPSAGSG